MSFEFWDCKVTLFLFYNKHFLKSISSKSYKALIINQFKSTISYTFIKTIKSIY